MNNRVSTLSQTLDLTDKIYTNDLDVVKIPINYKVVNSIIEAKNK